MGNSVSAGDEPGLPAEVYLHIASFLDVKDVPSVARVSRGWHEIAVQDSFWKGLYQRRFVHRQGADLPPLGPRLAAWPVARRPSKDAPKHANPEAGDNGPDEEDDDDQSMLDNHEGRERAKARAQALLRADSAEREADERRLEEEEMARIRRELPQDAPNVWKTCFQRRLRMKEGVCLVFLVGSNSLPYAADMVDKLRTYGVKVNSTCTIQQPYDGKGVHEGWKEELHDHLQRHSVVIFFANIAGGNEAIRAHIGDEMADFVEAGGSVVLAAFATCNVSESPGGRWQKRNYFPIGLGGQTSGHVELDRQSEGIDHHLLHGVRRAYASYHGVGEAHAQAKVMGRWSDKSVAMARLKVGKGTVVAVNFFPPSSDIGDGGWPSDGQGWMGREDHSSAHAWMYQFLDRLNAVQPEGEEGEEASDANPTEGADDPDRVANVLRGMEIPPEVATLLMRPPGSGTDPWQGFITPGAAGEGESEAEGRGIESAEKEELPNDVMVMFANAIKYGLWKASRLEPRKSSASATSRDKKGGLRRAAMKSTNCLLS